MELKDTIELMNSPDYKQRFIAEYKQLEIRIDKLTSMLSAWDCGELKFTPKCSYELLEAQLQVMKTYAFLLRKRAKKENINLYPERNCAECKHAYRIDEMTLRCEAKEFDIDNLSCFVPKCGNT